MMKPATIGQTTTKEIFLEAIEKATDEERAAYLDGACGQDAGLRQRVEELLARHFQEDGFMRQPAVDVSTTLVVPMPECPGTKIDRYKLMEKLGEGGFGVVYVAEQREPVKRRVALKIIKLGMDTRQVIARFEAERQALALMDHPNISKVLDAGATETGRPYFVMELVRGIPITRYCDENKLPPIDRLNLFIAVCHAIQHAHQKGIIHRDIKPSNILVTLHDGVPVPKVIDFGIAKATQGELTEKTIYTQFQQFIGTPAYVSPEQAEMSGLDMDTRSDIYSLGVLLYELLTSKTPFDGEALMRSGLDELRRTIREQDPPRPSTRLHTLAMADALTLAKGHAASPDRLATIIRGDLDWIVMKCLEKDRARRYDTASDIAADLKRYMNNEPVIARPPSTSYQFAKFVRRHQRAVAAAGAVAMALVLGLSFATVAFLRERQARVMQVAAEKAKQAETVRADAVGAFVSQLLMTTAPELLRQGHQRPVRELLAAADELASTALSNAPVAEVQLRGLMGTLYFGEGQSSLLDPSAFYDQANRITKLLSLVPDEKLTAPKEMYRINAASAALWAGQTERGLAELQALKDEFGRQTPPANNGIAACLGVEGQWRFWKSEPALAEQKLNEALRMAPAGTPPQFLYGMRIYLAMALADRGAPGDAEQVLREGLLPAEKVVPDLVSSQVGMVGVLASALCQQLRFAEADAMLLEWQRELSVRGVPERELLALEKKRGEVIARAGDAPAALDILTRVATNSLSGVSECSAAASVAVGSGDLNRYRQLCALGLARYAAGAEGIYALTLAEMFLAAPQNEVLTMVVSELVGRKEQARDFSKDMPVGIREWLRFREGNAADAAALLPRAADRDASTTPIVAMITKSDHLPAILGLRRALALGHLGRFDEARSAYEQAVKIHGSAPVTGRPRDLGIGYAHWYQAEAHRREVEELFKAKGIALSEGVLPAR